MSKGRPKKECRTTEAILASAERGEALTYEDAAKLIGEAVYVTGTDHVVEPRPITAMGVYKVEQRALAKLRRALGEEGVKCLADVIEQKACFAVAKQNILCSEVY